MVLAAIAIGLGWLVIAACHPDHGRGRTFEYVLIGLALGTIWAQGTLAAAWTALGPLELRRRLPMSLGWLAIIAIAFGINLAQGPGDHEPIFVVAGCLAGQWLLVQIPIWGLARYYGLQLEQTSSEPDFNAPRLRQFGIRQLMALTAIVAVLLGLGRLLVPWLARSFRDDEIPIFIFLTVAGVVMTLPLLLAVLLPRYALVAVTVVASLTAAATLLELPLLTQVSGRRGGGPDIGHLVAINVVQSLWIVGIGALVRLGGYRLTA